MGITKRNYPNEDIKNLTKEKAIHYYYRDYWMPMDLDLLNDPNLILEVFDMGVNSGIRTAIKILQRIVGTTDDGILGKITASAVQNYGGDIVDGYKKRRKLFYVTLAQNKPNLRVFLKGWLNRVDNCRF